MQRSKIMDRAWLVPLVAALLAACSPTVDHRELPDPIADMRPLCGEAAPADTRVTGPVTPVLATELVSRDADRVATRQYRTEAWALDEYIWQTGLARIWLGPAEVHRTQYAVLRHDETATLQGCNTWLNRVTLETIARRIDADTITRTGHAAPFGIFTARHFRAKGGTWRCVSINRTKTVAPDGITPRVLQVTVLDCRHPKVARAGQSALIEVISGARFVYGD